MSKASENYTNRYKTLHKLEVIDQDKEVINKKGKHLRLLSLTFGIIAYIFLTIKTIVLYPQTIDNPIVPDYVNDLIKKDFKLFFIPCLILIITYTHLQIRNNYKWALTIAILTLIVTHLYPFIYAVI